MATFLEKSSHIECAKSVQKIYCAFLIFQIFKKSVGINTTAFKWECWLSGFIGPVPPPLWIRITNRFQLLRVSIEQKFRIVKFNF